MTLRGIVAALCIALCGAGSSHSATAPSAGQSMQDLPALDADSRVVWGLLLDSKDRSAFGYFTDWLGKIIAANKYGKHDERLVGGVGGGVIVPLGAYLTRKDKVLAAAPPNIGPGRPETPFKVDSEGESYQGVNVALVSVDAGGGPSGIHALSEGLRSGGRFKLRVIPTFDAMVVLDRIDREGRQRQIYPATSGQVVAIPAGMETLLPLGEKEYLQFNGAHGRDRLSFTVRDPRSLEAGLAASTAVFRNDDAYGSNFIQEVRPDRFPVIAEIIPLPQRDPAAP